jgi:hypothetical protein
MEEAHKTHKDITWGWVAVLADWKNSRTRRRLRRAQSRHGVQAEIF